MDSTVNECVCPIFGLSALSRATCRARSSASKRPIPWLSMRASALGADGAAKKLILKFMPHNIVNCNPRRKIKSSNALPRLSPAFCSGAPLTSGLSIGSSCRGRKLKEDRDQEHPRDDSRQEGHKHRPQVAPESAADTRAPRTWCRNRRWGKHGARFHRVTGGGTFCRDNAPPPMARRRSHHASFRPCKSQTTHGHIGSICG
jgi:hypothetical protein